MPVDYELEEARKAKRSELHWWLIAVDEQVVTVGGVNYHAGYDSAMRLDAAKRLSELAGLTTCTFTDVDNVAHELSLVDAEGVILSVGAHYQAAFQQKQAWAIQIANATTIAELPVIVWP